MLKEIIKYLLCALIAASIATAFILWSIPEKIFVYAPYKYQQIEIRTRDLSKYKIGKTKSVMTMQFGDQPAHYFRHGQIYIWKVLRVHGNKVDFGLVEIVPMEIEKWKN